MRTKALLGCVAPLKKAGGMEALRRALEDRVAAAPASLVQHELLATALKCNHKKRTPDLRRLRVHLALTFSRPSWTSCC
eukprot:6470617-Amphidinium_carterae.1